MTGGDVVKFGLIGVGGYLIWQLIQGQQAPAASTTTGGGTTGGTPGNTGGTTTTSVSQATITALAAAGASLPGGVATADQWSYFWSNTLGKPAIDPTTFDALFFPSGRPVSGALPTMTAAQFVTAVATKGLSGYRGVGAVALPIPLMLIRQQQRGRGYSHVGRRP